MSEMNVYFDFVKYIFSLVLLHACKKVDLVLSVAGFHLQTLFVLYLLYLVTILHFEIVFQKYFAY